MARKIEDESKRGGPEALPLKESTALTKQFYAGARMESPLGGKLELLGFQGLPDGSARLFFECTASSLRFEMTVSKGTRRDREKIKEQVANGEDPVCPRCFGRYPLDRVGQKMRCSHCGVAFGKAL